MENKTLHIVNGDSLAEQMQELNLPGEIVVWRELLCEGPTQKEINSDFFKLRKKFLLKTYNISAENYEERFVSEIKRLKSLNNYDNVVLWFEFDLFCHINMLAAISILVDKHGEIPISLVCSKKLKGEKELQALSQLSLKELENHYKNSIQLNHEDIEAAALIWELYCGDNPLKLKPQIKINTNFEYLSSCIRAHIERFPNSITGINSLERNVLRLIENQEIKNENHLLGYALQYQGYYGYSDTQMQRLLKKLSIFYHNKEGKIVLNEKGQHVLEEKKNFYRELNNEEYFGGTKMYAFLYESESHRLLKL
ncbi:DUF1835 domain-containing protein [Christiangramia forsetii]|uniref:DUF1835 domain-containing protein n=2 Tax=Christiangramia forsetii TaxID=411153 RepID=A0M1U7_CHRFK|nr:DUF1835 domain-containing protein [Christiangramia forsetii]GGG45318.1 hypothetical protein GCM10011532_31630 [Christiangramia forsetii]CAL66592.1 hypothetical protein GFO_1619 [Christiangramia forsetii KT0803]